MTTIENKTIVVQFGILDWEAVYDRFDQRAASDVYVDRKFDSRVIWYLTQGVYKFYYASVQERASQLALCEQVWDGQGNNPFAEKFVPMERSFSMGDIVILSNETVWVCQSTGWHCLNPGVI